MSTNIRDPLAIIDIQGTPFEVGVALGRQGAETAHAHLIRTHAWATVVAARDAPYVTAAKTLVAERFPHYFAELQGLAKGLDLAFDDVFAWNCRGDIWAMSPDGCTTVQSPGVTPTISHNEDGDPGLRAGCAIARVRPSSGRAFASFVYPASLPGHTFAVSDRGLVMTVNNIRSRKVGPGLPRMIVTRGILDCISLEDAQGFVSKAPRGGAFHLTLGQAGKKDIVSVEFTHENCSILPIEQQSSHANHLIHAGMRNEPQIVTGSSRARQERGDAVLRASSGTADPLAILRDETNQVLPIYRQQPDDPDNENTLATAHFQIRQDSVACSIYDGSSIEPRLSFVQQVGVS
ncbi:C45 family autoproteolytic acyltransferase/hydolase [Methylovirgula sp. 4M-Z18]|uniref:C45 family autoproteolytic acyltransferase/hydolase n=1 Tax=Methylovirgula sp. 4M-Z18 TaxID=2293567 RepID=UPI000E2F8EFD|nr:C45 family peptidase [Methylovirgula sp. 4M-Z18]RFB78196.1 peptidase C45 [Methylovirgula sp. 4M-Z18]